MPEAMYGSSFVLDGTRYTAYWDGMDHPQGKGFLRYVEVSWPGGGKFTTYKLTWHTKEGWVRNGDIAIAEPARKVLGFEVQQ